MKICSGADVFLQLHQKAVFADKHMQGIERLPSGSTGPPTRLLSHGGDMPRSVKVWCKADPQKRHDALALLSVLGIN